MGWGVQAIIKLQSLLSGGEDQDSAVHAVCVNSIYVHQFYQFTSTFTSSAGKGTVFFLSLLIHEASFPCVCW